MKRIVSLLLIFAIIATFAAVPANASATASVNGFIPYEIGGYVNEAFYDANIQVENCGSTDRVKVSGCGGTNYTDPATPRSTMGVYSASRYSLDGLEILYSVEDWIMSGDNWYAVALTRENGKWFENDGSDDVLFFIFAYNNGTVTLSAHYVGNGAGWTYLGTSQGVPAVGGQYSIYLKKVLGGYAVYMKNAEQADFTLQTFGNMTVISEQLANALLPDASAYLTAGGYAATYTGRWSFVLGAHEAAKYDVPLPRQTGNGFLPFAVGGLVGGRDYDPDISVTYCDIADRVLVSGRGGTNYGDPNKTRSTMGVYSAEKFDIDDTEILYSVEDWVQTGNHWYAVAFAAQKGKWFENNGSERALFFLFAYNNGQVTLAAHYVGNGAGWTYLGTSQGIPAAPGQYGIFLQKTDGGYKVYMKNAAQADYTPLNFDGNALLPTTLVDGLFPDGNAYLMAGGFVESDTAPWSFVLGARQKQIPSPKITSASLILDEDIDMVYTVSASNVYDDVYMDFTMHGQTVSVRESTPDDAGGYRFVFSGITPQCMGDNISATVHASVDTQERTDMVAQYSVRKYCTNLLESSRNNVTLNTLLSDLLSYGAAAQTFTGYRPDDLVTSGLDLAPSSFTALAGKSVTFSGEADAYTDWISATLVLSNDLAMRLTFAADSIDGLCVDFTINGRTQSCRSFEPLGDGRFAVTFRGIKATEFDDAVTAVFKRNGEAVGRTISYSANTYISVTQDSENANLAAIVQVLYNYGKSAQTYAEKQQSLDYRNYDCNSSYLPRVNFGAKFEPKGNYILHGAGQDLSGDMSTFNNYARTVGSALTPCITTGYAAPHHDYVTWANRMRQNIAAYGDSKYLLMQVGVHFNEDENPDKCYYDKIASGEMDEQLKSLIRVLKDFGRPIFCRPGFEFNGEWNGYKDPEIYKAAFIRFAELVEECEADNIALLWCYNPDALDTEYMKYYPGDEYVDWWAIDIFRAGSMSDAHTLAFLADAEFHEKPVMITEATPYSYDISQGKGWSEWFETFFDFVKDHPVIKATCYLNWNWSGFPQWDDWGNACMENAPAAFLTSYRRELQDPIYFHSTQKQTVLEELYGS